MLNKDTVRSLRDVLGWKVADFEVTVDTEGVTFSTWRTRRTLGEDLVFQVPLDGDCVEELLEQLWEDTEQHFDEVKFSDAFERYMEREGASKPYDFLITFYGAAKEEYENLFCDLINDLDEIYCDYREQLSKTRSFDAIDRDGVPLSTGDAVYFGRNKDKYIVAGMANPTADKVCVILTKGNKTDYWQGFYAFPEDVVKAPDGADEVLNEEATAGLRKSYEASLDNLQGIMDFLMMMIENDKSDEV